MTGINKVIIVGRLGNDPEMRTMPNGDPVARISVATSEEWTDIRHHLAWEEHPEGGSTVNFGTPIQLGSEPLAKMENID